MSPGGTAGDNEVSLRSRKRRGDSLLDHHARAKRSSAEIDSSWGKSSSKEAYREEIGAIYRAFQCLCQDDAGPAAEQALQRILESARGSSAAKRLASRLLARFAVRFAGQAAASAVALTALSSQDNGTDEEAQHLASAARCDALQGFLSLCQAPLPDAVLIDMVEHLLRRSQRVRSSKPPRPPPDANGAAAACANGGSPAAAPVAGHAEPGEAALIRAGLAAAFRAAPQATLGVCLQALRKGHGELCGGARMLLSRQLLNDAELNPSVPPSGEPGTGYCNGACAPAAADGTSGGHGGTTLFAQVLQPLPQVQTWLRQAVASLLSEGALRGKREEEVRDLLKRLLEALPEPPRPVPPPPAAAPSLPPPPPPLLTAGPPPVRAPAQRPMSASASRDAGPAVSPAPLHALLASPLTPALPNGLEAHSRSSMLQTEALPAPPDIERRASGWDARAAARLPGPLEDQSVLPVTPAAHADAPGAGGFVALGGSPLRVSSSERLPWPGGATCAVAPCLWVAGLPLRLPEATLRGDAEQAAHGPLLRLAVPPAPARDVVLLLFSDIRHAACCYEAWCGMPRWGSGRPLDVEFCEDSLWPLAWPVRPPGAPRQLVWVAGVADAAGKEAVLSVLASAGVPAPDNALRVSGRRPGLVLQFAAEGSVDPAVAALRAYTAGRGVGIGPRQASSEVAPAEVAQLPAPPPAPLAGAMGAVPGAEPTCRTLWVGQVGPEVVEDEMLAAFQRYGPLAGWKFLRRSHCAFIDYEAPASAAAARAALHGARFGPCQIRIEFKDEGLRGGPRRNSTLGALGEPPRALPGAPTPGAVPGPARGLAPSRGSPLRQRGSFDWGRSRDASPPYTESPLAPEGGLHGGRSSGLGSPRASKWDLGPPPPPLPAPRGSSELHALPCDVAPPARASKWGPPVRPMGVPLPPPPGQAADREATSAPRSDALPAASSGPRPAPGPLPQPPPLLPHPPPLLRPVEASAPMQGPAPDPGVGPGRGMTPGGPVAAAALPRVESSEAVSAARPDPELPLRTFWRGCLAKSGATIAEMLCCDGPDSGALPDSFGGEPAHWPGVLDVTMRVDQGHVVQRLFGAAPPSQRAVRRLTPAPLPEPGAAAAQRARFVDFLNYLSGRSRAGVVHGLPGVGPGGGTPRTMYLIAPTTSIAQRLQVAWEPVECLIALVMPASQSKG